jgi:hypothetical protein
MDQLLIEELLMDQDAWIMDELWIDSGLMLDR